jgi:hypothetical protein
MLFSILLILAIYFSLRGSWLRLFFLGLVFDLITSNRLGTTSGIYLAIGAGIYSLKRFLPGQPSETIRLKI